MQNSKYADGVEAFPEAAHDVSYHRHIVVITQFESKLNSTRLQGIMKSLQNSQTKATKVSLKGFHFRLAEE